MYKVCLNQTKFSPFEEKSQLERAMKPHENHVN
jgi:hypothetical protein